MADQQAQRIAAIKQHLAYQFNDASLLDQACTHASFCDANAPEHERLADHNERMEFLGDGLLGAAIGEVMYRRLPHSAEGSLSRLRSHLVSRNTLALAMDQLGILDDCPINAKLQTPWPASVKANFAESILAAIYLDGGWQALQAAVDQLLSPFYDEANKEQAAGDAKNQLQTYALREHKKLPCYESQRHGGTDHDPLFTCTVRIDELIATAEGSSKRRAESAAARKLLDQVEQS